MSRLIDPRLRTSLPDFWPSRCSIKTVTTTASASGQKVRTGTTDVAGMTSIQCRMSVTTTERPNDQVTTEARIRGSVARRNLKLSGYFPTIQPDVMVAVVDGVEYAIYSNEPDSEHFSTRLGVDIIKP